MPETNSNIAADGTRDSERGDAPLATAPESKYRCPSDLFVLGCGRSGTSLVAGLFRNAGYFMGRRLYAPMYSNPTGFFEDAEINQLNEQLLERMLPKRSESNAPGYGWDIPEGGHRWLSRVPFEAQVSVTADELHRIAELTSHKPFCFKDPRFSYTLEIWREFARQPKFICVFRHPAVFVSSVFAECLNQTYLRKLAISVDQLLDVWSTMYRHILDRHSKAGNWIFVQYERLLSGEDLNRLESFAGIEVDRGFVNTSLNRSSKLFELPEPVQRLFDQLVLRGA